MTENNEVHKNSEQKQRCSESALNNLVIELRANPDKLVGLMHELSKLIVFDKWQQRKYDNGYERMEPGRNESRVTVYEATDGAWYYRIGFGVIELAGFSNRDPFPSAKEAMGCVDEILHSRSDIVAA